MGKIYIQFQIPNRAEEPKTENASKRSIRNLAIRIIKKIIPVAHPDFENRIMDVEYWLLECDEESGLR